MHLLEEMINLERRRAAAWLERDKDALAQLLDDDYLEINIFGRFSKDRVLNELFDGHVLEEYLMSNHRLIELCESATGLSYLVKERLRSGEAVSTFTCNVTALWKLHGDRWSLLLWQITPFEDEGHPH